MKSPPLPSLRALTADLRALHEAWSHPDGGPAYAVLTHDVDGRWHMAEESCARDWQEPSYGREMVGARDPRFDAIAAARRLLAAARDGGCK